MGMSKFIGIELLAANALIDIIEETGCRTISLFTLDDYAVKLSDVYKKNNKDRLVVYYNADGVDNRFLYYPEFFELDYGSVSIKQGVSTDELRKVFRTPLPSKLIKAILNEEVRNTALGVSTS